MDDKGKWMPDLAVEAVDYLDRGGWRTFYLVVRNVGPVTARAARGKLTLAPLPPLAVKPDGVVTDAAIQSGSAAALSDVALPWAEMLGGVEAPIHPGEVARLEIGRARNPSSRQDVDFTIPTGAGYYPPRVVFAGPGADWMVRLTAEDMPVRMAFGALRWRPQNPTIELNDSPTPAFLMPAEARMVVAEKSEASAARLLRLAAVGGRWSRGEDIERRLKRDRDATWPLCLVWSPDGGGRRAALFLQPGPTEHGAPTVVVSGVYPVDGPSLPDEVRAAAVGALRAELSARGPEIREPAVRKEGLPDHIGPRAAVLFHEFTRAANKQGLPVGGDLSRWLDFLIQLHRDAASPPRDSVEAALRGDGFGDATVERLMDVYDLSGRLLERYDESRGEQ